MKEQKKKCQFLNGNTCCANREHRRLNNNKDDCSKCASLKREPIKNKN